MNLEILKELNLSDGQIKVYEAVLEIGISNINKIQEKTGLERRNIYDILNKLIEKGFISYTIENKKKTYQCTHPDNILQKINKKKNLLNNLEKQIPQITGLFNVSRPNITAEVFRGNESLKALLNEVLKYKESYWIGGDKTIEDHQLWIWFNHWMKRRFEKKHMMYDLMDYGEFIKGFTPKIIKKEKNNYYYKYCFLPKNLSSPLVTIIFGNKVAQVVWTKQPFAFVIESKTVKDGFMKYFYYFWKE